jgi:hypothetical protein
MRKALVAVAVIVLARPELALAWDPDRERGAPASQPTPAPTVAPDGLYRVTEVYSGDVVTTTGNVTSYDTTTVQADPGTYARVVDVVRTGESSVYDGRSMNVRAHLPDGRAVAGTYYEDFVPTSSGFVSVNIVFFQDDRAFAEATAPTPAPATPAPVATRTPPLGAVVTPPPFASAAPWTFVSAAPRVPTPPVATRRPIAPAVPAPSAGVALGPTAPVLASIEVLRGRTVHMWLRAFVGGAPVAVRAWRLVEGSADRMSRVAGSGVEPLDAMWTTLAPAGSWLVLRFEVSTDAAPGRTLVATISVIVRSPALLQ